MKFRYQRWMIKTSIVYLIVGTLLGLCMFLGYRFPSFAWALRFRTTHVHLLLVGFVIQMIMAVALWMFPRRKTPPYWTPDPEGLTLYILLNLGTIVRSVGEAWAREATWAYWGAAIGMSLQIVSIGYFVFLIFPRIRRPGGQRS